MATPAGFAIGLSVNNPSPAKLMIALDIPRRSGLGGRIRFMFSNHLPMVYS